ncbi:MAG: AI-2E family transporter [Candidatus Ventricola sp.]
MRRRIACVLLLAAGGAYVYLHRGAFVNMLAVLLFSAAFTLLLAPLCQRLERRGWSSAQAAAASVGCLLLLALIVLLSFLPYLVAHSIALVRRSAPMLTSLAQTGSALLEQLGLHVQGLSDMLAAAVSSMTAMLARGSVSVVTQAGRIGFALVITYYLLRERHLVANHLMLLIPIAWRMAFLSAMRGCRNAVMGYLSGVIKTSVFVFAATYLGLLALGVRDALLLALFMGVFEVLPYIGPVLASVPIVLSVLPMGLNTALLTLGLIVLIQQVEGNFVSPYFTASSTSIHPLAALVSVFVLGSLLGFWGILLAVPLVVTARSVFWSLQQAGNLANTA